MIFTASTHNDGKITSRFYVADSDGRNQKLLSEVTTRDGVSASWSPKGDKIALIENQNLYTINPDGSGMATIALSFIEYAWHPSGDYIAFSSAIDKKTGKDVDHSIFWPKEESFTIQAFISKPDGTERVQITLNDTRGYNINSWSPDGSRLLIESRSNQPSRNEVFIAKLSGYAAKQGFRTANKSIKVQEPLPGQSSPEPTVITTPQSAASAATPKAPAFDAVAMIGILFTINLFKRRYN